MNGRTRPPAATAARPSRRTRTCRRLEALKLVGDTFAHRARRPDRRALRRRQQLPGGEADPYIIRGADLARGGEAIDESVTVCTPRPGDPAVGVPVLGYPGTVGWKTGFRFLRDAVLTRAAPPPVRTAAIRAMRPAAPASGASTERGCDIVPLRAVRARHRAAEVELPCLDGRARPSTTSTARAPVAPNPDFHVPAHQHRRRATSPAATSMVTLGALRRRRPACPIGTPFMQASTLDARVRAHAERRHGGEAFEPNCKPTYLSVMNYLYQLRGLLDDDGTPHLDFSGSDGDRDDRRDGARRRRHSVLPYRLGWYAPLATQLPRRPRRRAAAGTATARRSQPERPCRWCASTRARRPTPSTGTPTASSTTAAFAQDVNFNGRVDRGASCARRSDDWANLQLDQIGSRRNVGGLYRASPARTGWSSARCRSSRQGRSGQGRPRQG